MPFDLSDEAWEASLPEPGIHNAKVTSVRLIPKDEMTLLLLVYEIVGKHGEVHHIEEFLTVDAPGSSSRLAQGKGRVKAILIASGRPISFDSVDRVPASLIGCRVSVVVGRRIRDSLPVPVIESVQGPASDATALPPAAE
jgi:hypothetical protein